MIGGDISSEELLRDIIENASDLRASDIHLDPKETKTEIRIRVHGLLRRSGDISLERYMEILIKIKIACGLKIDDHQNPKDGSWEMIVGDKKIALRVSIIPTSYGENIVMRIFKNETVFSLPHLGFDSKDSKVILLHLSKPGSIGIVMGPTGSGKTTTLYTLLHELKKEHVMAVSIEDPIESNFEGVRQIQVSSNGALTFSNALRSILRQDPDIILIGEIRDYETARLAFQAALTGHVVITSIHAYNMTELMPRLHSFGVPDYLLKELRIVLINQRLVEKLCSVCKFENTFTEEESEKIKEHEKDIRSRPHFKASGCDSCGRTGIEGRVLAYEIEGGKRSMEERIVSLVLSTDVSLESALKHL